MISRYQRPLKADESMRRAKRTLAIMALTLASCSAQIVPASTPTIDAVILRLNGTSATLPLLTDLTRGYAQIAPTVSFEINVTNYAAAVDKAFSGDAIYFLTNHLPPSEESALWGAPVAQDGIAIITYPGSGVDNLTTEQIRAIYQGRISNWDSLGGPRMAITVISREDGSGTRAEFERLVMGERQTTQTAQIAPSSSAVIASVARQPGSIGYVSIGYLNDSVQPISINEAAPTQANVSANLYPLRTTIFFAGPGEPDGALRAFIGWVQSPDGQAIVAQHYAPL
jgi:phosphate transport system substrate-binding protein